MTAAATGFDDTAELKKGLRETAVPFNIYGYYICTHIIIYAHIYGADFACFADKLKIM